MAPAPSISTGSGTIRYAIFIQDSKIIDQRAGVALDRCKQQTYQAYEPSSFIHQDTKVIRQKKAAR